MQWFPRGILDVILVIHYYEAWLAFLAILIWHMYSTVFMPGVYPMNPAWITGKMPQRMFEHEHPLVELVEQRHTVRTRIPADGTVMEGREKVDPGTPRRDHETSADHDENKDG